MEALYADLGQLFVWQEKSRQAFTSNAFIGVFPGEEVVYDPLWSLLFLILKEDYAGHQLPARIICASDKTLWVFFDEPEDKEAEREPLINLIGDVQQKGSIFVSDMETLDAIEQAVNDAGADGSERVSRIADLLHRVLGKWKRDEEIARTPVTPIPPEAAALILDWAAKEVAAAKARHQKNEAIKADCARRLRELAMLIETKL